MSRRLLILIALLALAVSALSPVAAGAQTDELVVQPDGTTKDVVESETGSYIVVMEENPVVAAVGQEDLGIAENRRIRGLGDRQREKLLELFS